MLYEITITLRPKWYRLDSVKQFEQTSEKLYSIFRDFDASIIAELTGEHNVHYHGIVRLDDIQHKNRLMARFRPHHVDFGRKSCTQLQFETSYIRYMLKDKSQTELILKYPIVMDKLKIFINIDGTGALQDQSKIPEIIKSYLDFDE